MSIYIWEIIQMVLLIVGITSIFNADEVFESFKCYAIDLDEDSFDKVLNTYNELKTLGLSPYIERSKSKGFHIWVWFTDWVDAIKPRLVVEMILEKFKYWEMGSDIKEKCEEEFPELIDNE